MDVKSAREGLEIMEKYPKVVALMKDLLKYIDVVECGIKDKEIAYDASINSFKAYYKTYIRQNSAPPPTQKELEL